MLYPNAVGTPSFGRISVLQTLVKKTSFFKRTSQLTHMNNARLLLYLIPLQKKVKCRKMHVLGYILQQTRLYCWCSASLKGSACGLYNHRRDELCNTHLWWNCTDVLYFRIITSQSVDHVTASCESASKCEVSPFMTYTYDEIWILPA